LLAIPPYSSPAFFSNTLPVFHPYSFPAFSSNTLAAVPPCSLPAFPPCSLPAFPLCSLPAFPPCSLPAIPPCSLPAFSPYSSLPFSSNTLPAFSSYTLPAFYRKICLPFLFILTSLSFFFPSQTLPVFPSLTLLAFLFNNLPDLSAYISFVLRIFRHPFLPSFAFLSFFICLTFPPYTLPAFLQILCRRFSSFFAYLSFLFFACLSV
jgi:hypothetical protein